MTGPTMVTNTRAKGGGTAKGAAQRCSTRQMPETSGDALPPGIPGASLVGPRGVPGIPTASPVGLWGFPGDPLGDKFG